MSAEVVHVTDDATLRTVCERLSGASWLGLDTEFIRDSSYYPQLCLIQVAGDDLLATIDPLSGLDLAPLDVLLEDRSMVKVLHASRQDLEVLLHHRGSIPWPVFDTQLAASLQGHGDQAGYAKLVQSLLGVPLGKGETRTDWSKRPLDAQQLEYAIDDVRYLGPIHERLRDELQAQGRTRWLDDDFAALSDPGLYRVEPEDAWRRVKGAGRLKGGQRAALKALAEWRERTAQEADRPRNWILKDEVLVDLARGRPRDEQALGRLRGLPENTRRRHGQALIDAIAAAGDGAATDEDDDRGPLSGEEEDLLSLLQLVTRLRAREIGVSAQSLATRKELAALLRGESGHNLARGWRHEALGSLLDEVMAGRHVIRNGPGGPELIRD